MAKEIKAIKCPNCGSVGKTQIKTDFYKCDNCQTEYFLDNDDVNINYNHNYSTSQVDPKNIKKWGLIIGLLFGVVILINIMSSLFDKPVKQVSNNSTYSAPVAVEELDDQSFRTSRYFSHSFLQPSTQKPLVIMLENRDYKDQKYENKNGSYIAVYDPINKKLVSEEKVSEKRMSSSDFKFRTFSDGNIYIVHDKTNFLKFDQETLKIENVGQKFFEAIDELQVGVATLEFVTDTRGDGLILLTNDGKKRLYYPLIQKLYTENQFYKAYNGFKTVLPNSKEKTIHLFTSESSEFPEEKIQLIKLTYIDNGPGPKDVPKYMSWGKDYGRSGIFYDSDPYKKRLINAYLKQAQRVLKLDDLTPDRLYFGPSILLDDGIALIIQFRANANTASDYKIQKIDRKSGDVLWTSDLPEGKTFEDMIQYKDGLLGVNRDEEMIVLDHDGSVVGNYKLE